FFTPSENLVPKADDEPDPPTYLIPPPPPDELERRKALYRFNILHTSPDVNFDRITHLCKLVFSTKMVIISLIDADEQWFKSEHGIASAPTLFYKYRGAEPLVVLDTHQDWRFMNNPMVVGPPQIRFYAGAPLRTSDGYNVGSLCVIDDRPHEEFTPRQRHTLKEFAAIVMREMELWRDKIQLQVRDRIQTSMERFTRECLELEEAGPQGVNSMEKVYDRAAKLVKRALDVEGALVVDIANLECVEITNEDGTKSYSYRGDTFADPSHAPAAIATSPSLHGPGD
ncbi:His Kinase A domain containing protein, partial [Ceratobasidium sp. 395]